ncbi:hypothetical protein ASF10_07445 [Flavobacterium sp. Leaf82]|nr:hypothetical protein ASF10_07445 [Flavobacterium sp. Leaf82]
MFQVLFVSGFKLLDCVDLTTEFAKFFRKGLYYVYKFFSIEKVHKAILLDLCPKLCELWLFIETSIKKTLRNSAKKLCELCGKIYVQSKVT